MLISETLMFALLLDQLILPQNTGESDPITEEGLEQDLEQYTNIDSVADESEEIHNNTKSNNQKAIFNLPVPDSETKVDFSSGSFNHQESNIEAVNSKKKTGFFNNRMKMAKKMVGDIKKMNAPAKSETNLSTAAMEPAINSNEVLVIQSEKPYKNKTLFEILSSVSDSDFITSYFEEYLGDAHNNNPMLGRTLYALHNAIIEFAMCIQRIMLRGGFLPTISSQKVSSKNNIDSLSENPSLTPQTPTPTYSQSNEVSVPVPAQRSSYYYFEDSRMLLRIENIDNSYFKLDIHSPYESDLNVIISIDKINTQEHQHTTYSSYQQEHSSKPSPSDLDTLMPSAKKLLSNLESNKSKLWSRESYQNSSEFYSNSTIDSLALSSKSWLNSMDQSLLNSSQGTTLVQSNTYLDEMIIEKGGYFDIELSDLKHVIDTSYYFNEKSEISQQSPAKFENFDLTHIEGNHEAFLNYMPYRIKSLLSTESVYKLHPSNEEAFSINELAHMYPASEINVGVHFFSYRNRDNSKEKKLFSSLANGLLKYASCIPSSTLRINQQKFASPESLGYQLFYHNASHAVNIGANQFIFYLDDSYKGNINPSHLSLKLANEGLTGVKKIDENIKKLALQIKNDSDNQNNPDQINDFFRPSLSFKELLNSDNSSSESFSSIKIFYLVSVVQGTQNNLFEVNRVIHGCNQLETEMLQNVSCLFLIFLNSLY
ncbi:hypothetical protein BB560_006879 [Smittium megazygosporum]|uniref:Uncharacterized protein n=1 Tax=Smittium megazygosporum TaxID=133381 RepID=A0A2T9Y0L9_9FUNG|nr:hypothetical protein BB560_006879 [Smittium megazygosporum]